MKKFLVAVLTITSLSATAQMESGLIFDLNLGARFGGKVSDQSTLGAGMVINGGVGYMFSNIVGIQGDLGYTPFNAKEDGGTIEDRSATLRASLQGVLSVSELAGFGTDQFGLNFHAGFGFATNRNPYVIQGDEESVKAGKLNFADPMFKGQDDMVNVIFGLNPQYHINENISVNVDISHVLLLKQSQYLDRELNPQEEQLTGGHTTATVGLRYNLPM